MEGEIASWFVTLGAKDENLASALDATNTRLEELYKTGLTFDDAMAAITAENAKLAAGLTGTTAGLNELAAQEMQAAVASEAMSGGFKVTNRELMGVSRILGMISPQLGQAASMLRYGIGAGAVVAAIGFGKMVLDMGVAEETATGSVGVYTELKTTLEKLGEQAKHTFTDLAKGPVGGLNAMLESAGLPTEEQMAASSATYEEYLAKRKHAAEVTAASIHAIWGGTGLEKLFQGLAVKGKPSISESEFEDIKQAGSGVSEYYRLASISIRMVADETEAAAKAQYEMARGLARTQSPAAILAEKTSMIARNTRAMAMNAQDFASALGSDVMGIIDVLADAVASGDISMAYGQSLFDGAQWAATQMAGIEGLNPLEQAVFRARIRESVEGQLEAVRDMGGRIRSALDSALQSTFTGDPTNVLDRMGMHIDTADEDARRMASVMAEGLHSGWVQYFAGKGLLKPEDLVSDQTVVAAAARLLRAREMGDPTLLNADIAKQRVREYLKYQAEFEAFKDKIARDMGLGVGVVGLALGDPKDQGIANGQQYGTGWQAGFVGGVSDVGWVDPVKVAVDKDWMAKGAQLTMKFREYGNWAGKSFVFGMTENVDFVEGLLAKMLAAMADAAQAATP